jgi:LysM repeat protein
VPLEELAPLQWYTVRRGESLTTIANKLRVRRADLADANYLSVRAAVTPGQKLVVPLSPSSLLASRTAPAGPTTPPAAPSPAARPGAETTERVAITYYVRTGDTLSSIARQFHTTVADLRAWNGLKTDRIMPGARLTIHASRQRP